MKWETGWQRSTCYRTYQGDFLWELLPLPAPAKHRSRETPSTDLQGVTASPAPLPTRESQSLVEVSERHCQRVGSSFRRSGTNRTFYILHYMWLCTICWYPDDGVHVWNIWYLAFSRRHEIKMYNSQSYLCFCNCHDKSTLLLHLQSDFTYFSLQNMDLSSFNLLISSHMSMPRFSVDKLNMIISTMLLV